MSKSKDMVAEELAMVAAEIHRLNAAPFVFTSELRNICVCKTLPLKQNERSPKEKEKRVKGSERRKKPMSNTTWLGGDLRSSTFMVSHSNYLPYRFEGNL